MMSYHEDFAVELLPTGAGPNIGSFRGASGNVKPVTYVKPHVFTE